jgi:hypothetical protein
MAQRMTLREKEHFTNMFRRQVDKQERQLQQTISAFEKDSQGAVIEHFGLQAMNQEVTKQDKAIEKIRTQIEILRGKEASLLNEKQHIYRQAVAQVLPVLENLYAAAGKKFDAHCNYSVLRSLRSFAEGAPVYNSFVNSSDDSPIASLAEAAVPVLPKTKKIHEQLLSERDKLRGSAEQFRDAIYLADSADGVIELLKELGELTGVELPPIMQAMFNRKNKKKKK